MVDNFASGLGISNVINDTKKYGEASIVSQKDAAKILSK